MSVGIFGVYPIAPSGYANTWLIEEEGNLMAVDVGTRRAAQSLYRFVTSELKVPAERLLYVTATHFHFDHIAGTDEICRLVPGARVRFSHRTRPYLSGEEKPVLPPLDRWISGLGRVAPRIPRILQGTFYSIVSPAIGVPLPLLRRINRMTCRPVCDLREGTIVEGFSRWSILETPGHTPDSICLYNEGKKILITGDTVLNLLGRGELNAFCSHPEDIQKSVEGLLGLSVETILPGHGKAIVGVPDVLRGISRRGV
ncbi:MAG: MBL fold metallo-hydrolase [Syntrophales bacterium]|jgi:glyoxylase-like metal-dependent hydrolase (beta-lactamase superfamily II)|nr:MBL fold metallo-hydrolase [Syntrophales bacterium]MCK9527222.1 MBL fold metallo-hydrolase [Syntrophales bacterium]MDX9921308.1 MBL fold metallo-hydrolase [Syntrophales bacterium]